MIHSANFSGGKDSTAMLLLLLKKGYQVDVVLQADMGMEFPEMRRHIEKVKNLVKVPFLEGRVDFKAWQKAYGWPSPRRRWCTGLKLKALKGLLVGPKLSYIGISWEERDRIKNLKPGRGEVFFFPLVEWGMTGEDALQFCYQKGLDWEGLYESFSRGSCFCCPLMRENELRKIWEGWPELWEEIKEMDNGKSFKGEYSVFELEEKFKGRDKMNCEFPGCQEKVLRNRLCELHWKESLKGYKELTSKDREVIFTEYWLGIGSFDGLARKFNLSEEALSVVLSEIFLDPPGLSAPEGKKEDVQFGKAVVKSILETEGPLKLIHDYGFSPSLIRKAKEDIYGETQVQS